MTLFLLFLCLHGIFAFEFSVFQHQNISTLVPDNDCPTLYYGENCTIPYCCPETSHLVHRGHNDFYCNCTAFTRGTHCEIVECHRGKFSRFSLKCECPLGIFGDHCEREDIIYVCFAAGFFILLAVVYCAAHCDDDAYRRSWSRYPEPPASEIPNMVNIVIQERADGPPPYDSVIRSADPPKYSV
uniref:EGF-like domain-containing protein n=1 Tax=Panagrellus redivivus TaxID=6233 RepID=A0A7E4VBE4_PANRE